ncbi:MAG: hypothetical protein KAX69_04085 [Chitinophagales bacterium]|nr:hypothetical protein [Chitinophagales bacterium]
MKLLNEDDLKRKSSQGKGNAEKKQISASHAEPNIKDQIELFADIIIDELLNGVYEPTND